MHDAYGRTDPAAERAVDVADTADTIESAPPMIAYPTEPTGRSERPDTCPFLRAVEDGVLTLPIEAPDAANRCVAVGPPAPQSAAQQQIVCLTASHVSCPRYLRGALVPSEPASLESCPTGTIVDPPPPDSESPTAGRGSRSRSPAETVLPASVWVKDHGGRMITERRPALRGYAAHELVGAAFAQRP